MKRVLKMMISLSRELLNKIIDKESERVNKFNRYIFDAVQSKGGED
jgi:hypothetical protein